MGRRNSGRVRALKTPKCRRYSRVLLTCAPRRGFSLIEIMIAIIILGLGLVMVASMFPVAWKRARQLSEHTVQGAVVESAHTTVASLVRVATSEFTEGDAPSFMGDLVFDPTATGDFGTGRLLGAADTRVHLLHLENVQLPDPGGGNPQWRFIPEDPFMLELAGATSEMDNLTANMPQEYLDRTFLLPRVRFHQRVYPPLTARINVNPGGSFTPGSATQDPRWDALLQECGYCWAVFHRLRVEPDGPPFGPWMDPPYALPTLASEEVDLAAKYVDKTRFFDLYYVTLRRPQTTHRYAQQDVTSAPDPFDPAAPFVEPAAQGPDHDCVLPVPWRVQVYFPFTVEVKDDISLYVETGIPTEIEVNTANALTAEMVVEMFQKGSYFIDEITGEVFRVTRQRVTQDPSGVQAYITVEREVFPGELDVRPGYRGWEDGVDCTLGLLDPVDVNRTVWVFPPPVDGGRNAGSSLTFVGPQPVVGVDIRTLTVSP